MNQVYALAILGAIWLIVSQHLALRRSEEANDYLCDTLRGLAKDELEAKIDTDGDIAIRRKRDQLGEK
jgi:hypothetical protein